ncbi:MAG: hypothetical protein JO015_02270 [Verrucomicrobia bacterium]|nr:hypothetical protein [Verrucomicrobiota bacterium]
MKIILFSSKVRKGFAVALTLLSLSTLVQAAPSDSGAPDQNEPWARLCRRWVHFWDHHGWGGWGASEPVRVHESSWQNPHLVSAARPNGSSYAVTGNGSVPVVPEANAGMVLIPVMAAALCLSTRRLWVAKASADTEGRKGSR